MKIYSQFFVPILLLLVLVEHSAQAMEYDTSINCYYGTPITPQSIVTLACPPEAIEQSVRKWLDKNNDLTRRLTAYCRHSTHHQTFVRNVLALQERGLKNCSEKNYIFRIPYSKGSLIERAQQTLQGAKKRPECYMQIAGTYSRVASTLAANDWDYIQIEDELGLFHTPSTICSPKVDGYSACETYQTVSRAAHYLRAQQICTGEGFHHIEVPATYVVLFDKKDTFACDQNSCVVQEAYTNHAKLLCHSQEYLSAISQEVLTELVELTRFAGLWDVGANVLVTPEGKLIFADFEQPFDAPPNIFFHRNYSHYEMSVYTGLRSLLEIMREFPESRRTLQDVIAQRVSFKNAYYQKELEKKNEQ